MPAAAHTHDGIDWVARLADLRRADEANGPAHRAVADRLIKSLPAPQPTVLDVGCGAGGMSAALAAALATRATATTPTDLNGGPHPTGTTQPSEAIPPGDPTRPGATARPGGSARSAQPSEAAGLVEAVRPDAETRLGESVETARPGGSAHSAEAAGLAEAIPPGELGGAASPGGGAHAIHSAQSAASVSLGGASQSGDAAGSDRGVAGGGTLVLVDAVPELLAAAAEVARAAAGVAGVVDVRTVRADLAGAGQPASSSGARMQGHHSSVSARSDREPVSGPHDDLVAESNTSGSARLGDDSVVADGLDGLPAADLVWASHVAHHLPDQRRMVAALATWLAPGGCLALAEGGLSMRCLPWDVGIGEPGLQDRLIAAHGVWFHGMRTGIPGSVRLPVGWNLVLAEAG
jgi:SAM-dependent methyltransferase